MLQKLKLEGDEQVSVNIITRAIEEPMRWIATNGSTLTCLLASEDWPSRGVVYRKSLHVSLPARGQTRSRLLGIPADLPYALPAYLDADLPPFDRRNPLKADRRAIYRGGQHASDIPRLTSDASEIRQQSPPLGRVR